MAVVVFYFIKLLGKSSNSENKKYISVQNLDPNNLYLFALNIQEADVASIAIEAIESYYTDTIAKASTDAPIQLCVAIITKSSYAVPSTSNYTVNSFTWNTNKIIVLSTGSAYTVAMSEAFVLSITNAGVTTYDLPSSTVVQSQHKLTTNNLLEGSSYITQLFGRFATITPPTQ